MSIKTLIVDDEALAREGIALRLAKQEAFTVVGTCGDGLEAVEAIAGRRPDLVFLDVQMPRMDGFDVVESIGPDRMPMTIFVTAFEQHAVAAFEAQALDYLLKPIDDRRFEEALERSKRALRERRALGAAQRLSALLSEIGPGGAARAEPAQAAPVSPWAERLAIKSRGRTRIVKVADLRWLEADDDYIRLHLDRTTVLMREALSALAQRLDPRHFVQIHKKFVVRIDLVVEVRPTGSGDSRVHLNNGTVLRLSRSYRRAFDAAIRGKR